LYYWLIVFEASVWSKLAILFETSVWYNFACI